MTRGVKYDHEFAPIFCPNCGTCVNEPDEILGAHSAEGVNCYWCQHRHSIDQVKVCRQLAHVSEQQLLQGAKARLLQLSDRLSSKIRRVYTRLAFTREECEELQTALRDRRNRVDLLLRATRSPNTRSQLQHSMMVLSSLDTAIAEALIELERTDDG